jgi:hypothetical protein
MHFFLIHISRGNKFWSGSLSPLVVEIKTHFLYYYCKHYRLYTLSDVKIIMRKLK